MTPVDAAPVQRRRLRSELRRARTMAGFTQKDVADAMDWSPSKLIRIEAGSVKISITDLKALLQFYQIEDSEKIERFVSLARASKDQRAWWNAYREATTQQYLTFLGFESSASVIYMFQPLLVPGLLQDEDYTRAVLKAYGGSVPDKRVEELIELRMRRQELLDRQDPPEMYVIVDEAVLHRWVGGRTVMRHQLNRLKDEAARSNLTLDVVPFSAGEHPGMKGPFTILEFADDRDEDVLFLENPRGDTISRDELEEIKPYHDAFVHLRELAATEDAEALIDKALKEMS